MKNDDIQSIWEGKDAEVDPYSEIPVERIGYTGEQAESVRKLVELFINGETTEGEHELLQIIENSNIDDNIYDKAFNNTYTDFDRFLRVLIDNGKREDIEKIIMYLLKEGKIDFSKDGDVSFRSDLRDKSPKIMYAVYQYMKDKGFDEDDLRRFLKEGFDNLDKIIQNNIENDKELEAQIEELNKLKTNSNSGRE